MTVPRFQVVRRSRSGYPSAPHEPGPDAAPQAAGLALPQTPGFAWQFLSANNRILATSAQICPDVESCLAAIRILRADLPRAVGETVREGNGQWLWRIRVADEIVATATRTYQRPVRARLMCHSFLQLAPATEPSAPIHVIYRSPAPHSAGSAG